MKKALEIIESLLVAQLLFVSILIGITLIYGIQTETIEVKYLWNITNSEIKVTEGSVGGEVTNSNEGITLNVKLKNEEEFYEFTYDINNEGNLDALITKIDQNIESTNNILIAKITYLDGSEIKEGDIIKSKETKTIKVRIEYPKQESKIYDELTLKLSYKISFSPSY